MSNKPRNSFKSNIDPDTDTHDMLVQLYLKYFKENEKFEKNCSWRSRWRTRQLLKEISLVADARRKEIYNRHNEKLKQEALKNPEAYQIRKEKNIERLSNIKKDGNSDGKQE